MQRLNIGLPMQREGETEHAPMTIQFDQQRKYNRREASSEHNGLDTKLMKIPLKSSSTFHNYWGEIFEKGREFPQEGFYYPTLSGTNKHNGCLNYGTLPANKNEFAGTVPANKNEFAGNVPVNKNKFAGRVPANKN